MKALKTIVAAAVMPRQALGLVGSAAGAGRAGAHRTVSPRTARQVAEVADGAARLPPRQRTDPEPAQVELEEVIVAGVTARVVARGSDLVQIEDAARGVA